MASNIFFYLLCLQLSLAIKYVSLKLNKTIKLISKITSKLKKIFRNVSTSICISNISISERLRGKPNQQERLEYIKQNYIKALY